VTFVSVAEYPSLLPVWESSLDGSSRGLLANNFESYISWSV
jgi:hypothetical protein